LKPQSPISHGACSLNELEIVDRRLTGKLKGVVIDGPAKARYLETVARERGIDLSLVVAIGDGANDQPMLAKAGASIGFQPKPVLLNLLDAYWLNHSILMRALL
jgi:phosphoserine phosphatase